MMYIIIIILSSFFIFSSASANQSSDFDALIKLQEKSLSYNKASYELLYAVSEKFVFVSFLLIVAILVYLLSKLHDSCCHSEKPPHTVYTRV